MTRPTFTSKFEETETAIRDRMLDQVSEEWRKEPGDFIYDTIAADPPEVKQLQINQDTILKNSFAQFAENEYLDYKLAEVGLTRIAASANKRALSITADAGVVINAGHTLYAVILDKQGQPLQYTVDATVTWDVSGAKTVNLTSKTAGTIGNLATGSQFILQPTIPGVRTIADQGTTVPGRDTETDEEAWLRFDFKVANPDTGGNKFDYVRWAQEVTGVGKAKCVPRWNGNNTVKVVIVGTDFTPATPTVVTNTQAYIDPNSEGLGNGKAPCGAAVTVAAAANLAIAVTATIVYTAGADQAATKAAFEAALVAYLKGLVFSTDPNTGNNYPVVYNKIAALLIQTEGISNYSSLTINGGTVDIAVGAEQAPTKGLVTFE